MARVFRGAAEIRATLLRRRALGEVELGASARARLRRAYGKELTPAEFVERVFDEVGAGGDAAVLRLTEALDGRSPTSLRVSDADLSAAAEGIDGELRRDLEFAAERIRQFHRRTVREGWFDDELGLGQVVTPIQRVGIYAPGGTASYPSSILMTAIPAAVAGVAELCVCTPAGPDGRVPPAALAAAQIAGVKAVFAVGGAQAVAAMALGTETIPRVDKIAGPGNVFVVLAMRRAFGLVGVSILPGPTETLIIADATANPDLVAADLLAQAEHDELASPLLLTDSESLAGQVARRLEIQLAGLPRRAIAAEALATRGGIGVVGGLVEAIELANEYAPEHLCLMAADPKALAGKVRNAGGVFLGADSPEVIGDYVAGPSHVMPVGGTARFASPVGVGDFQKLTSVFAIAPKDAAVLAPIAARLARAEGLEAHARAAEFRIGVRTKRRSPVPRGAARAAAATNGTKRR